MSRPKTHVRKGDTVEVIAGNHKGATGTVLMVDPVKERVLIEGVRMVKKHQKRSAQYPEGGIIEKEGPIHISNVQKAAEEAPVKKKKRAKA